MGLFRRKKARARESDFPVHRSPAGSRRKATLIPMEVKLLALEALQTGLYRRPPSKQALARCQSLERRIVERRQAHPERGVRRIRDDRYEQTRT